MLHHCCVFLVPLLAYAVKTLVKGKFGVCLKIAKTFVSAVNLGGRPVRPRNELCFGTTDRLNISRDVLQGINLWLQALHVTFINGSDLLGGFSAFVLIKARKDHAKSWRRPKVEVY